MVAGPDTNTIPVTGPRNPAWFNVLNAVCAVQNVGARADNAWHDLLSLGQWEMYLSLREHVLTVDLNTTVVVTDQTGKHLLMTEGGEEDDFIRS